MKVSFACPSCSATGAVDQVHIGKQVRCKHCGARFAIPDPAALDDDVYALEEVPEPVRDFRANLSSRQQPDEGAVFVPARTDASTERFKESRRSLADRETPKRRRPRQEAEFPWQTWLIRGGLALVLVLAAIALLAPHGTWLAGCILVAIGSALVPVAYFAGAYGAFSEDPLYGFLYLLIPFYTAYYLATRWEDLWIWIACATAGVGLVLAGTELIRWAGAPV